MQNRPVYRCHGCEFWQAIGSAAEPPTGTCTSLISEYNGQERERSFVCPKWNNPLGRAQQ